MKKKSITDTIYYYRREDGSFLFSNGIARRDESHADQYARALRIIGWNTVLLSMAIPEQRLIIETKFY